MALAILDEQNTITVLDSELVPDGDPETSYVVKVVPAPIFQRLQKEAAKGRPGMRLTNDDVDGHAKLVRLVIDYMLVSWTGVIDKNTGEPVPMDRVVNTSVGPLQAKYYVLDSNRYGALLDRASKNEVISAKRREETFRPTE